jgi:anaerobic magnesium-protoporphyrin IX monomethyl ester cyclase
MKLILVYPPRGKSEADSQWYPLGIASLAANNTIVHPKNIVCLDLIDKTVSEAINDIRAQLSEEEVNFIGFTMMTDQRALCLTIIKALKGTFFKEFGIKIIVGGPHPSIMAEQLEANYPEIDYIVKGEGEKALNVILETWPAGKIVECKPLEMDSLIPAIKGMKFFKPAIELKEAPITFSRGCDGHCTFCATNKVWKGYRARKASDVYAEMMEFKTMHDVEYFKVQDDSASSDMMQLKVLCKLLEKKDIAFEITTRIDRLDFELIDALALAGCRQIAVGIESGSEKMRKSMGKNLDMAQVKANTQYAQSKGIQVHFLLIVGYPGETSETIQETCEMLYDIKPSSYSKLPGLMIVPGSPVYNKFVKEGFIDDSYWLSDGECPYYTGEYSLKELEYFGLKLNNAMRRYKVLVCGVVNQEERVFKEYLARINAFELEYNVEVQKFFILHNSTHLKEHLKSGEYLEINNNLDHNIRHEWTGDKLAFIAQCKNQIVAIAKKTNITHLLWVDSDLMVPKNTLKHLIYKQFPIIAACFWTKWQGFPEEMPNAWDFNFYEFGQEGAQRYRAPNNYIVGGSGACLLVDMAVYNSGVNYSALYNVPFSAWEDRAFSIRAVAAGFQIILNTELEIKHLYTKELIDRYFLDKRRNEN